MSTDQKLNKHEIILVIVLFLIFVSNLFFLSGEGLSFGGITLWYSDFAYLILGALLIRALVLNKIKLKKIYSLKLFIWLIVIIVLKDIYIYNIKALGNLRAYFPLLITVFTISFVNKENVIKIFSVLIKYILPFIIIALIFLEPKSYQGFDQLRDTYQILNASTVLVISVFFFVIILLRKNLDLKYIPIIALFFIILIISQQHRTVWLFFIASGIYLLIKFGVYKKKYIGKLIFIISISFLVFLIFSPLILSDKNIFAESIMHSFRGLLNPEADPTANWRILYWYSLLSITGPNVIWGWGFYALPTIIINGYLVPESAHNMYLYIYMNLGLLGVAIFLAYYFRTLNNLRKKIKKFNPGSFDYNYYALTQCILIGMLFYGLGYSLEPIMFFFLGLAEI